MIDEYHRFMTMSAVLTGYSVVELEGTGQGRTYFHETRGNAGPDALLVLLDAFEAIQQLGCEHAQYHDKMGELLTGAMTGPLAHDIMRMWLTGNWYSLGDEWHSLYGGNQQDQSRVVSASAYREGLVWENIGAHPMSAKQPGFGTWAFPPSRFDSAGGDT
jgi:hypothetical protein